MGRTKLQILKNVVITPQFVRVDSHEVMSIAADTNFKDFIRELYKSLKCSYPKFYKMDRLSKLAFLAAELLTNKDELKDVDSEKVALLLENKSSTLDTDQKFIETIEKIPSPAVFVYTLPNIAIGELAIRHKWKGENLFLVSDVFDAQGFSEQIEMLFNSTDTHYCICGWLEYASEKDFKVSMWLVSESISKQYRDFSTFELNTDFGM